MQFYHTILPIYRWSYGHIELWS